MFDKQKLLDAAIVRKEVITIEGQSVTIREVGTLEFSTYGEMVKKDKLKATAALIAASVIDGEDKPVFNEEESMSLAKTVRVAVPLVAAVMKLSGIGGDDDEEAEKHSDAS